MPTIRTNNRTVTHINTFACRPEQQQALIDSLTETVATARGVPRLGGPAGRLGRRS